MNDEFHRLSEYKTEMILVFLCPVREAYYTLA